MFLRTEILLSKKLAGKNVNASLLEPKSAALWGGFMPLLKEIKNRIGTDLFSVQLYGEDYFNRFNPANTFTKWAAAEVQSGDGLPDGMELFILPEGLYAVFLHKGTPAAFAQTAKYIYAEWLPSSVYELDHRPHLEILGEKYRNNADDSEEEIWIPIRKKSGK